VATCELRHLTKLSELQTPSGIHVYWKEVIDIQRATICQGVPH